MYECNAPKLNPGCGFGWMVWGKLIHTDYIAQSMIINFKMPLMP